MEVEDGYPNYLVEKGTFFTRPEGIPLLMDFKKTDGNSRLLVSEMKACIVSNGGRLFDGNLYLYGHNINPRHIRRGLFC